MIVGNVKNSYTDMASYNSTEKVTVKNTETTVSKAVTKCVKGGSLWLRNYY